VTGISLDDATVLRDEVIGENVDALRKQHREKRRHANRKYHVDGGAPRTEDLWPEDGTPSEDVLYGKLLLTQVEKTLRDRRLLSRGDSLMAHPSDELRAELEAALSGPATSLRLEAD
jgi:hypothetical protein